MVLFLFFFNSRGGLPSACLSRMSLQIFNDKNVTGDKSTENCDFLFLPPELTGRSTVLRLSQKENVPPKSTAKAMKASVLCLGKVCVSVRSPWVCVPGDLLR